MRGAVAQAAAAAQLVRANFQRLARPLKVNLCVTYWCQYRCKTCNIWKRKPSGELTTAELMRFVEQNPRIQWLDVTGGEIFLRPDLPQLFGAIAASWKGLAIFHFATNGFLTERIVSITAALASATRARVIVTVSIDGDERHNDEIRGVRGGFRRQIETFKALRGLPSVEVVFGMTLSRHNADRFEETFLACRAECPGLTIDDFHINVAQRSAHYYGNADDEVVAPVGETRRALARYRRLRGVPRTPSAWVESRYLHHLDRFLETEQTPMPCHALRSSCFINPDGDVFPCITDTRCVGSLRATDMSLDEIWLGEPARAVQSEIWAGRCPQCWTACEAYHSIVGNLLRPGRRPASRPV